MMKMLTDYELLAHQKEVSRNELQSFYFLYSPCLTLFGVAVGIRSNFQNWSNPIRNKGSAFFLYVCVRVWFFSSVVNWKIDEIQKVRCHIPLLIEIAQHIEIWAYTEIICDRFWRYFQLKLYNRKINNSALWSSPSLLNGYQSSYLMKSWTLISVYSLWTEKYLCPKFDRKYLFFIKLWTLATFVQY